MKHETYFVTEKITVRERASTMSQYVFDSLRSLYLSTGHLTERKKRNGKYVRKVRAFSLNMVEF